MRLGLTTIRNYTTLKHSALGDIERTLFDHYKKLHYSQTSNLKFQNTNFEIRAIRAELPATTKQGVSQSGQHS